MHTDICNYLRPKSIKYDQHFKLAFTACMLGCPTFPFNTQCFWPTDNHFPLLIFNIQMIYKENTKEIRPLDIFKIQDVK